MDHHCVIFGVLLKFVCLFGGLVGVVVVVVVVAVVLPAPHVSEFRSRCKDSLSSFLG